MGVFGVQTEDEGTPVTPTKSHDPAVLQSSDAMSQVKVADVHDPETHFL